MYRTGITDHESSAKKTKKDPRTKIPSTFHEPVCLANPVGTWIRTKSVEKPKIFTQPKNLRALTYSAFSECREAELHVHTKNSDLRQRWYPRFIPIRINLDFYLWETEKPSFRYPDKNPLGYMTLCFEYKNGNRKHQKPDFWLWSPLYLWDIWNPQPYSADCGVRVHKLCPEETDYTPEKFLFPLVYRVKETATNPASRLCNGHTTFVSDQTPQVRKLTDPDSTSHLDLHRCSVSMDRWLMCSR